MLLFAANENALGVLPNAGGTALCVPDAEKLKLELLFASGAAAAPAGFDPAENEKLLALTGATAGPDVPLLAPKVNVLLAAVGAPNPADAVDEAPNVNAVLPVDGCCWLLVCPLAAAAPKILPPEGAAEPNGDVACDASDVPPNTELVVLVTTLEDPPNIGPAPKAGAAAGAPNIDVLLPVFVAFAAPNGEEAFAVLVPNAGAAPAEATEPNVGAGLPVFVLLPNIFTALGAVIVLFAVAAAVPKVNVLLLLVP